jgi:hypothetical protein
MMVNLGRDVVNKIGIAVMAVGAVALLSVSACDRIGHKQNKFDNNSQYGDSADRLSAKAARRAERMGEGGGGDRAQVDAPKYKDGTPIWAANRRRSAQDNIDKMFQRNGADFGAASADDYVAKVHAFIDSPPQGVQTATRANGDKLLYDAKTNTFAVVTSTGAPRIMMKPRDGKAYWTDQLANLDQRGGYGQGRGKGQGRNRGGFDRGDKGSGGADDNG